MGNKLNFPSVRQPADKTIVITGANTGIGYETAKHLAMLGARVIIACRSESKANEALAKMSKEYEAVLKASKAYFSDIVRLNIEFMPLDLSSIRSTMTFIEQFKAKSYPLNVLICNAGLGLIEKRELTEDGYEVQFQVNYLSHTLLILHLMPLMLESGDEGRIVSVSSSAHSMGKLEMDNIQGKKSYSRMGFYGNSKLFQVMQTSFLARKLPNSKISFYSLHPGAVDTEFQRNITDSRALSAAWAVIRNTGAVRNAVKGAMTSINCAINPDLANVSGRYYDNCKQTTPSSLARNQQKQQQLWDYTVDCLKNHGALEKAELLGISTK